MTFLNSRFEYLWPPCWPQEQLKLFWTYAYAEESASKDLSEYVKRLSADEDCSPGGSASDSEALLWLNEVVARLEVFSQTLRPGTTHQLEVLLTDCLKRWCSNTDTQYVNRVASLVRKAKSCCANTALAEEMESLSQSLSTKVSELAKKESLEKLDQAFAEVCGADIAAEDCFSQRETWVSACSFQIKVV